MNIGDQVKVHCTDTGSTQTGTIERISKNMIGVLIDPRAPVLVMHKQSGKNVYVGNIAGMEFVVKTNG